MLLATLTRNNTSYNVFERPTLDQTIPPLSGRFVQEDDSDSRKEYTYQFACTSDKFVEWHSRITRNNTVQEETISLIYVSRPYLTAVDVTERRNLVYNFRSLLSRDSKGHVVAGVYFKLREVSEDFTIMYREQGKKRKKKLGFDQFRNVEQVISVEKLPPFSQINKCFCCRLTKRRYEW